MTDISKEAVEKLAKTADLFAKAMKAWQHKTQKHNEDVRDTLLALSARVQELEATIDGPTYLAGKEYGRLQALDEAANAMHPMLRSMISRGDAYRTILALKGDTQ